MNMNEQLIANISTSLTLQILLPFKITFIIATVTLNAIVIYIIVFKIKKRTYSNLLFLSKSLADMIVGASSMTLITVSTSYGYWPLGHDLCVFWIVFDCTSTSVSCFNLLLISGNQYKQIKKPFSVTEKLNVNNCIKIFLAWFIPATFWLSSVIPITSKMSYTNTCYFTYTITYVILSNVFLNLLPIIALIVFNCLTFYELKMKKQRVWNSERSPAYVSRDRKAATCLTAISITMLLCFAISLVTWPVKAICGGCVDAVLYETGYWLTYIASTVYPILLMIFHEKIRTNLFKK